MFSVIKGGAPTNATDVRSNSRCRRLLTHCSTMERYLKAALRFGEFRHVSVARSRTMSAIRGRGNRSTERALRMVLVRAGVRGWHLNVSDLPGRPDFLFLRQSVAVFVDGCFWHGCGRCCPARPRTNTEFWRRKIVLNQRRDRLNSRRLQRLGIRVVRIWECDLNNQQTRTLRKLQRHLHGVVLVR